MNFYFSKIINLLRGLFYRFSKKKIHGWSGNFSTWEDAKRDSIGYDNNKILEKVKNSLMKVKNGEAAYERDSVLFDKIEYSYPLLSAILWVASQKKGCLNLVDFGGSLGSTYFQNKQYLKNLDIVSWNIVEQGEFVKYGKLFFEDNRLKFFYSINECIDYYNLVEEQCDAILFSSVIQYLESPYTILNEIVKKGFRYIVFDRTSFNNQGGDTITIQKVPAWIYDASYPAWFFDEVKFLNFFHEHEYELIDSFNNFDMVSKKFNFKGFIFRKIQ